MARTKRSRRELSPPNDPPAQSHKRQRTKDLVPSNLEATGSDRKSKRSHVAKLALPAQAKSRAPARCAQGCEGAPLRSQCKHTPAGRQYLLEQNANQIIQDLPNNPFVNGPHEQATVPPIPSPGDRDEPGVQGDSGDTSMPGPPGPLGDIEDVPGAQNVAPMPQIDPLLFSTPSAALNGDHQRDSSATPTPASTATTTPCRALTSTPRVRSSASRPIYNHIKGVNRGNVSYEIFRKHEKPAPLTKTRDASKYFIERLHSVLETLEDVATRTGAWIFLGAQHPAASGGALNYSSPRLRRDGGTRTDEFATDFLKLIQKSVEARRVETIALQKTIEKQQEELAAFKEAADASKAEAELMRATAAANAEELARFREQYRSVV